MLYAYGATIIEIVRRKEFCKRLPSVFMNSGKNVIVAFMKLDSSISVLRASLRLWPKLRGFTLNLESATKPTNLMKGQREKTPSSLQRRSTWSTSFRNQGNG